MTVEEGEDVKLRCEATGDPTPVLTWKREDGRHFTVNNTRGGMEAYRRIQGELREGKAVVGVGVKDEGRNNSRRGRPWKE
ncbi:hypothetical protein E2C01_079442 [Portunus trituberculatus]|uniref:Ig-like domain-containing protein n=1 Tax=Portunus trituberculatus TaxID=210409 RepID=A0A5B7ISS5_PORTR|nr:hypothetical protein [Portunus trituberculatus]